MIKKLSLPFLLTITLVSMILNSAFKMENPKLRIALSAGSVNYKNYILRANPSAEIIDMKGLDAKTSVELLKNCDGIIFTGGEDVEPSFYGKAGDSSRCKINLERDIQEFALIKEAFNIGIPIFGICRGQQILNVALGGTLIVDIPEDYKTEVLHREDDYLKCYHPVTVKPESLLAKISKVESGPVSSNHHQAVDKLAPGLVISAWSADGIAEAMEWINPAAKPFFIAVQWHPERMEVYSALSMPIMHAFLESAEEFNHQK